MKLKKLIETFKDINKKANALNKNISNKNTAKFANNPFKENKQGNTYVWLDKD